MKVVNENEQDENVDAARTCNRNASPRNKSKWWKHARGRRL